MFAHSSCTFLLLLLFIKSKVYCPAHFIAHFIILFFILILHVLHHFFHTSIYVYSLVFVLHIIALSMERT